MLYPHIRRLRGRAVKSAGLPDRVEQCDHDSEAAFNEDLAPDGTILRDLPDFAADKNLVVAIYRGMALASAFDLKAVFTRSWASSSP
jgi:hypothetical protein